MFDLLHIYLFIVFFALYEATGINAGNYISKKQKKYSMIFRYGTIAVASNSIMEFVGYSIIMASIYDQMLNLFRDNIDFWYLSKDSSVWDDFWYDKIWFYIIFTISAFTVGNYIILSEYNII